MRAPNGWGTITKQKGNRRRVWVWRMTTGYEIKNGKMRQIQTPIDYFYTRQEAELARAKVMASGQQINVDARKVTFEQVYNVLWEQKFSKMKDKSIRAYKSAYNKCEPIKKRKMIDIDSDDMQMIIDAHKEKSASTQNNLIVLFKAMYDYAMKKDIVSKDYSQYLKVSSVQEKKKKIPFTREEVKTLWEMKEDWIRDSVLILLYTGMRIEELLTLKVKDVHIDERWIDLKGTKTKSAERIVPIHKKISPLLQKRLEGEYLYPAIRKGKNETKTINYFTYRGKFDPLMEKLDSKHTPHDARHTFASIATSCELNPILVKKIMGHASNDITLDRYTHAYLEDLLREIDKFDY